MSSTIVNRSRKFARSKVALAVPVTFLILFVTTLGLVSVTYYFAAQKVGSESQMVKIMTAKQSMLSLNDEILSVTWNPGSSSAINFEEAGGVLNIRPISNSIEISINDGVQIQESVFNSSIGEVAYELPVAPVSDSGVYLTGDYRTVVNQTGTTQSQVSIETGSEYQEIHLSYRPMVSFYNGGIDNGKEVNNVRIYVLSLNSSESLSIRGEIPLKIKCLDTQIINKQYDFNYQPTNLAIRCTSDGVTGNVAVPLSNTTQGAIINLEIVVVNVAVERSLR